MSYLIALDDGHGSQTPGKRTPVIPELGRSIKENEFNKAVVYYLGAELRRCGFRTLLVASGDSDVPLQTFSDLAVQFFPIYESANRRKTNIIDYRQLTTFSSELYEMDEKNLLVSSCVSIAMTNQFLLYSCGVQSDLVIGIKKMDEKLFSHAWIETEDGQKIDPQNHLGELTVMNRFILKNQVEKWVSSQYENLDGSGK